MLSDYDTDKRYEKVLEEINALRKEKHGHTEYDEDGRKDMIASLRRITNNPERTDFNEEAIGYIRNIYEALNWTRAEENREGIDIIFRKEDKIVLVKMSVSGENIKEELMHQFLGSVLEYKFDSPEDLKIGAVFYTSGIFSDKAKDTAKKFHIKLKENFLFPQE